MSSKFWTHLSTCLVVLFFLCGKVEAGIRVGILPAEDRWITLSDGTRVYQGLELSYLLIQRLFDEGKVTPVLLNSENPNVTPIDFDREEQIPPEWKKWKQKLPPTNDKVDFKIQPVVETLIFTSGERSNRILMGFTPEYLNPFNSGRSGAPENEFVASARQRAQCLKPDFFSGSFLPGGWGPWASNFGADIDEGVIFQVAGYGIGFKMKKYKVKSQIRFLITDGSGQLIQELDYKIKVKGQDVFFSGAYQGYSLGLEFQRRESLNKAVKSILEKVTSDFMKDLSPNPTKTLMPASLVKSQSSEIEMPAQKPAVADELRPCFDQKPNFFAETFKALFTGFAAYRYLDLLDQPLKVTPKKLSTWAPRIVMIDSGVDYNNPKLSRFFQLGEFGKVLGFDFLSWDERPSDDNGHGSAAALLLSQLIKKDFVIIPARVIGPSGETHSGAIYQAFQYAKQLKADYAIVPWTSAKTTQSAIQMGAQLAADSGVKVFMPSGIMDNYENVFMPEQNISKSFNSKSLGGSSVWLSHDGVATVNLLSNWINQH